MNISCVILHTLTMYMSMQSSNHCNFVLRLSLHGETYESWTKFFGMGEFAPASIVFLPLFLNLFLNERNIFLCHVACRWFIDFWVRDVLSQLLCGSTYERELEYYDRLWWYYLHISYFFQFTYSLRCRWKEAYWETFSPIRLLLLITGTCSCFPQCTLERKSTTI